MKINRWNKWFFGGTVDIRKFVFWRDKIIYLLDSLSEEKQRHLIWFMIFSSLLVMICMVLFCYILMV